MHSLRINPVVLCSILTLVGVLVLVDGWRSQTPAPLVKPESLEIVQSYTMPKAAGGITSGFSFANGILWSRGSPDNEANELMYSADYGANWQFVKVPPTGQRDHPEGLGDGGFEFVDPENGWAYDIWTLIRTSDGGRSWQNLDDVLKMFKLTEIQAIHFIDKDTGFLGASASYVIDKGLGTSYFAIVIFCTTDGGDNWRVCKKEEGVSDVRSIVSFGKRIAALSDMGKILYSDDLGKTWASVDRKADVSALVPDLNGRFWLTRRDGGLESSTDLINWKESQVDGKPITRKLETIAFSAAGNGFGVAAGADGYILTTKDFGATWKQADLKTVKGNIWTVRVDGDKAALLIDGQTIVTVRLK